MNRFNVGRGPVSTISKMLERVAANVNVAETEAVVRQRADSIGLATGSRQRCRCCKQIRDRKAFADASLTTRYRKICVPPRHKNN